MRVMFSVLLALASFGASAQEVVLHKCVGADGVPSFQSAPCGHGQRAAGAVTNWVTETPEQLQAIERRKRRDRASSRYLQRLAGTDRPSQRRAAAGVISTARDPARCEQMKRYRAEQLEKHTTGRTWWDVRGWLDDQVSAACSD